MEHLKIIEKRLSIKITKKPKVMELIHLGTYTVVKKRK
jgi:hypothetical protein